MTRPRAGQRADTPEVGAKLSANRQQLRADAPVFVPNPRSTTPRAPPGFGELPGDKLIRQLAESMHSPQPVRVEAHGDRPSRQPSARSPSSPPGLSPALGERASQPATERMEPRPEHVCRSALPTAGVFCPYCATRASCAFHAPRGSPTWPDLVSLEPQHRRSAQNRELSVHSSDPCESFCTHEDEDRTESKPHEVEWLEALERPPLPAPLQSPALKQWSILQRQEIPGEQLPPPPVYPPPPPPKSAPKPRDQDGGASGGTQPWPSDGMRPSEGIAAASRWLAIAAAQKPGAGASSEGSPRSSAADSQRDVGSQSALGHAANHAAPRAASVWDLRKCDAPMVRSPSRCQARRWS